MINKTFLVLSLACLAGTVLVVTLMARPSNRRTRFVSVLPSTEAPTTPAPSQPSPVVDGEEGISNIRVAGLTVLYPRVPLLEMQPTRRFEFVPGAVLPGLDGRRIEDATHIIITTYPGVTVRAVDQSEPLNLEVRRDRITLTVDTYTRRVVSARVG